MTSEALDIKKVIQIYGGFKKGVYKMSNVYRHFLIPKSPETGSPELELYYSPAEHYNGSLLCVPGICHGAWCFENFLEYFPKHGYDCYALSFRGYAGSKGYKRLNKYGLSEYSADIRSCITHCRSSRCDYKMKSKPFLLGHSMGGAVVQKYMGECEDTLSGAILFAPATVGGMNFWKTIGDAFSHKDLKIATCKALGCKVTDKKMYQSAFFNGRVPMEKIKKYNNHLQKESLRIIFKDLYKKYTDNDKVKLPVMIIGSVNDSYFPEKSLAITADVYGCTKGDMRKNFTTLPDLCHDMMLDKEWEKSAEAVLHFMEHNNPDSRES